VTDFRRQDSGTRIDFLNRVHVEIGKRRATHLRIGGVDTVHGEDGCRAALAVYCKLLREIGGPVGVGHSAGGEEQQLAEVALVERQAGDFLARKALATTALGSALIGCRTDSQPSLRVDCEPEHKPLALAGFESPRRRGRSPLPTNGD
jgi:hypothetical protein